MRHKRSRTELNRFTSWRKATLISVARSLLIYQSIKTTKRKALLTRPLVEKLISLAKKNTLSAKRYAYKFLGDHKLVSLLFTEIGPRFSNKNGGYTRIVTLGKRRGDDADLALFELTEIKKKEKAVRPKKEKAEELPKKSETSKEEKPVAEEKKKPEAKIAVKEKPKVDQKPGKKFLGGLKNIFKKERDSL